MATVALFNPAGNVFAAATVCQGLAGLSKLPGFPKVKTETLNQELDSLDKDTEETKGASGVRDFLSQEPKETDDSSSSPEELPGTGVGASALKNILERETRERSSSGEEWEKVSINTEEYTGTGPAAGSSEC